MAQLDLAPPARWSSKQSRAQYTAIACLRWRIFINGFRRKGGAGELTARIAVLPLGAAMVLAPTVGAGFAAWYFASNGRLDRIAWLLWGTFALCQFLNIQIGQPGTTFDPTQLIRFPLRVRNYIAIRLFFGLLGLANLLGTLIALAIVVGTTVAIPSLLLYALVALAVFATTNILFSRMVFAWVDRWLSTRRAREVFTAIIFIVSMGIQWANFTFNPAYNRHHRHGQQNLSPDKLNAAMRLYHRVLPYLSDFPPNLTSSALASAHQGRRLLFFGLTLGCALYAAAFFAIFAWRTTTEYSGENFSDQANGVSSRAVKSVARLHTAARPAPALSIALTQPQRGTFGLSSAVAAVLDKEWLTIRRNTGVFYGLIAPLVIVFLFVFKSASGNNAPWIFPAALAYAMVGLAPLAYNSFGLEGTGAQFYFLAPVRLRDVFLAKNLMNFILAMLEIAMVFAVITCVTTPPSIKMTVAAMLWITATMLFSMTVGNHRSITAPKKIETGRAAAKQASPLSALLSIGVLLVSAALGAALITIESYFKTHWILLPALLMLAAASLFVYRNGLRTIDRFTLDHREELFDELCKK
jgi:ABC-2 type transport system permease protein